MKETILAVAFVLVIVLLVGAVALFLMNDTSEPPTDTVATTTEPTTFETEPTEIQTESTEPTTEKPAETEPELLESGKVFIVNGVRMATFVTQEDETIIAAATEYLQALGLDADGAAHHTEKEKVKLSADGLSLSANGDVYDTVYGGVLYLPVYAFAEGFDYPAWVDDTYGGIYITPGAKSFELPENVDVPVLMYHAVSDNCWGYAELFVSPSSMEQQLKYLVDNGYDPIWFEDLAHAEDYDKPVILTFDDGYDDNYTELFPLLKKYNVKATVFVIGQDVVGIAHKLTQDQIREMSDSGLVSIQSHGYTHGDMDVMDEDTLEYELEESKKVLSRITGKAPYVLCYPTGKYRELTIDVAKRHYSFGLKMVGGLYNTSDDGPYEISRFYIARSTDIYTFASYISDAG